MNDSAGGYSSFNAYEDAGEISLDELWDKYWQQQQWAIAARDAVGVNTEEWHRADELVETINERMLAVWEAVELQDKAEVEQLRSELREATARLISGSVAGSERDRLVAFVKQGSAHLEQRARILREVKAKFSHRGKFFPENPPDGCKRSLHICRCGAGLYEHERGLNWLPCGHCGHDSSLGLMALYREAREEHEKKHDIERELNEEELAAFRMKHGDGATLPTPLTPEQRSMTREGALFYNRGMRVVQYSDGFFGNRNRVSAYIPPDEPALASWLATRNRYPRLKHIWFLYKTGELWKEVRRTPGASRPEFEDIEIQRLRLFRSPMEVESWAKSQDFKLEKTSELGPEKT